MTSPTGRIEEPGPGSQASLRQANAARILDVLRLEGGMTQAELARRTALAPSTVSGIVHDLELAGHLRVEQEHGGRRGRQVDLAVDGRLVAGIDVGRAHIRVGLANLAREIVGQRYATMTDNAHEYRGVLALARRMLDELLAEQGVGHEALVAAGLSLPAPIDHVQGRLVGARPILPGWIDIDLADVSSEYLGTSVVVENDANAAVLAEQRWGAGEGRPNVAYIKLGHGVGAGLVLGGELFRGSRGVSGEIGHMIVDERGNFCRCGNRGCLETVVNAERLLENLRAARPDIKSVTQLVAAAHAGDTSCRRLIADAGTATGVAAANLCNLINPDVLVIGGSLAAADELLLGPLRDAVERYTIPSAADHLTIATAHFGAETHLVGAIGMASEAPHQRVRAAESFSSFLDVKPAS